MTGDNAGGRRGGRAQVTQAFAAFTRHLTTRPRKGGGGGIVPAGSIADDQSLIPYYATGGSKIVVAVILYNSKSRLFDDSSLLFFKYCYVHTCSLRLASPTLQKCLYHKLLFSPVHSHALACPLLVVRWIFRHDGDRSSPT